jgi:hypothetical protein
MPRADVLSERELTRHLEVLLGARNLKLIAEQVRIGSFRLDAVAYDETDGSLVVVEVKTNRWCGTLAQLLLYPRALKRALPEGAEVQRIRALLVTTYLEEGLIDVLNDYGLSESIEIAVCTGSVKDGLRLVDPKDPEAKAALWDQADGTKNVAAISHWIGSQLRGTRGDGGS